MTSCFSDLLPCIFRVLWDGVSPWPHASVICCCMFSVLQDYCMWHMIQHLPGDMAHSLVALCFQCYEMAYVLGDMAHSFVAPCFQCYKMAYVPGDMAHSFVAPCFQCYEMAYVPGDMAHSFVAPCFQCYETAYVPGDMAHSFVALCFQSVAGLLHVAHDPASPWLHAPTVH